MNDYVIMPKADYQGACDAIRAKTGKTDLIKSGDMATEIESVSGVDFNIHYGTEAPEDTSKLWVKTSEPSKVVVAPHIETQEGVTGVVTLEEVLPVAWGGMASATVGKKIYLFAGATSSRVKTIRRFDVDTEKISTLTETMPSDIAGVMAEAVGTKIYLFGGYTGVNTNSIYRFDTETEKLTQLTATLPARVTSAKGASVGTKIYIVASSGYNGMLCFDTETEEISAVEIEWYAPDHVVCEAVGENIYVFGGSTNKCFDTKTQTTTTLGVSRLGYNMRSAVVDTKIFLMGGTEGELSGSTKLDTIWCFDTVRKTLTELSAKLPVATKDMGSGAVNSTIYLFGGDMGSKLNTINKISPIRYVLDADTLQILPKTGGKLCHIVDSDSLSLEIEVSEVYVGDENNNAQPVNAYLYNETTNEWELF